MPILILRTRERLVNDDMFQILGGEATLSICLETNGRYCSNSTILWTKVRTLEVLKEEGGGP